MARDNLHAWVCGEYVGRFERDFELDRPRFVYDGNASRSLSIALPRSGTFDDTAPRHYLNGLLPDQQRARRQIQELTGAASHEAWELLAAIGGDLSGGVVLHADPNGISQETAFTSLALEEQVAARIADIKQTGEPFSTAEGSPLPRFSLAGAQAKFALSITESGELFWSDSATPSTHIIKPESTTHSGLELLEAATLALARRVGIFAPTATQLSFLGETAFVIQRFDRVQSSVADTVARLHVEDMAQALGPQAADKYQVDAAEIVDLLRRHNGDDSEAYAFFAQYVFNTLIGNADAHAKNYSILHQQDGNVTVSPLYDAIPIGFFPGYDQNLSMPVANENRAGAVRRNHWLETASEMRLDSDHVLAILRATAEGVLEHLDATLGEVEHRRVNGERLDSLRRNAEQQLRC